MCSLMKVQQLGRNVTKKMYGESSNWFTICLYSLGLSNISKDNSSIQIILILTK